VDGRLANAKLSQLASKTKRRTSDGRMAWF